jgi:hypothetical protein
LVRTGRPPGRGGRKTTEIKIRVTERQKELYENRMEEHEDAAQLIREHIETWANGEGEDPVVYNADEVFAEYERFEVYDRADGGMIFLTDRGMTHEGARDFIRDYRRKRERGRDDG